MGLNRDPISSSQRFVAVMDTLTIGYMKWVGGEIVDHKMGLVADRFRAAHRNDLDDLGGENWEASEYGDRIDPWQKTKLLVLVSPTAPHDLFTFSTTHLTGSLRQGPRAAESACRRADRRRERARGDPPTPNLGAGAGQELAPQRNQRSSSRARFLR